MGKSNKNQQKPTKQPPTDSYNPFALLSDSQWRFVTALVENPGWNKKQAAQHIEIEPNTCYAWPSHVDDAIEIARQRSHEAAVGLRRQALLKAMSVKVALLDSDDENVRSRVATEIIEWELGKALQRSDFTTDGESVIGGMESLFQALSQLEKNDQNGHSIEHVPN